VWDATSGQELLTFKGDKGPVYSVAFSPDGKRLASAGGEAAVRLWDAASGQELLTVQGDKRWVYSVAFSPDGKRLATCGNERTVKVWDATSGQELLTLQGHTWSVNSVAFSPDGKRLASVGGGRDHGEVKLWDAVSGQEVLTIKGQKARMVRSVAFSPDGKRLATNAAGVVTVWETTVSAEDLRRREIVSLVREEFDRLVFQVEVLASLRAGPTLDASEHAFALQVAQTYRQDPAQLNQAAWEVLMEPGRDRQAYTLALRRAQAAVQAEPGDGELLNTLGVAQYRAGEYAKALETLTRSEKLNATKDGSLPDDLAFLAMAQHQLGLKKQAQETLHRLREVMKQPFWKGSPYWGFLREAEELLQGKKSDPNK
jgi:dipeptidyl aminopeptidase/acylaminoacyl peptidase